MTPDHRSRLDKWREATLRAFHPSNVVHDRTPWVVQAAQWARRRLRDVMKG